ncbi:hypothetical protein Bpfe_007946 [Biomphalaria pfeifferi]|uniref:Uncharacterized protein n=1 Tax=Biomphalaria pfeifferi TaxID=112525 RepID=A0AAD8BXL7_BIOPF|nr:hypothetical protein Bpfe_007946 [Biomphalaria pfeifferi]
MVTALLSQFYDIKSFYLHGHCITVSVLRHQIILSSWSLHYCLSFTTSNHFIFMVTALLSQFYDIKSFHLHGHCITVSVLRHQIISSSWSLHYCLSFTTSNHFIFMVTALLSQFYDIKSFHLHGHCITVSVLRHQIISSSWSLHYCLSFTTSNHFIFMVTALLSQFYDIKSFYLHGHCITVSVLRHQIILSSWSLHYCLSFTTSNHFIFMVTALLSQFYDIKSFHLHGHCITVSVLRHQIILSS